MGSVEAGPHIDQVDNLNPSADPRAKTPPHEYRESPKRSEERPVDLWVMSPLDVDARAVAGLLLCTGESYEEMSRWSCVEGQN